MTNKRYAWHQWSLMQPISTSWVDWPKEGWQKNSGSEAQTPRKKDPGSGRTEVLGTSLTGRHGNLDTQRLSTVFNIIAARPWTPSISTLYQNSNGTMLTARHKSGFCAAKSSAQVGWNMAIILLLKFPVEGSQGEPVPSSSTAVLIFLSKYYIIAIYDHI